MALGQAQQFAEVLRVDTFAIARMRRLFCSGYDALTHKERADLMAAGGGKRMELLHREMGFVLTDAQFGWWLCHVGLTEYDVREIEAGLYHAWPSLFRHYAELFNIEYTFLASGGSPYAETDMRRHTAGHRASARVRRRRPCL